MKFISTELDENIIGHLPQAAFNSVSKVSRYYRKLAEPYLYRDLVFSIHQHISISELLTAILDRRELSLHTRSLTLTNADHVESEMEISDESRASYLKYIDKSKIIFSEIKAGSSLRDSSFGWLDLLLND
jgi:hypothetical protein